MTSSAVPSENKESPIINRSVDRYLDELIPARDAVLAEMEQRARREHIPIVGPSVGRLLTL